MLKKFENDFHSIRNIPFQNRLQTRASLNDLWFVFDVRGVRIEHYQDGNKQHKLAVGSPFFSQWVKEPERVESLEMYTHNYLLCNHQILRMFTAHYLSNGKVRCTAMFQQIALVGTWEFVERRQRSHHSDQFSQGNIGGVLVDWSDFGLCCPENPVCLFQFIQRRFVFFAQQTAVNVG